MIIRPLSMVLIGLLTACSAHKAPLHESYSSLAKAEQCCVSLESVQYQDLGDKHHVSLNVSQDSRIIELSSGFSRVQGIKLPKSEGEIRVSIHSIAEFDSVFVPSILVLDSNQNPLDLIESNRMSYQPLTILNKPGFSGEFTLPHRYLSGQSPAYLLVFTTQKDIEGKTRIAEPNDMAIFSGDIEANIAHNTEHFIPHTTTGIIELSLEYQKHTSIAKQIDKQQQARATLTPEQVQLSNKVAIYHANIKSAVQTGKFDRALAYVEEAEREGIDSARSVFIDEMKHYQE